MPKTIAKSKITQIFIHVYLDLLKWETKVLWVYALG